MTAAKEERTLHRKLAQVMYEAERIPKRGKAPAIMGGFPFVQVGDAADYIRKALAEHQISMLPSKVEVLDKTEHTTKAGGSMTTVDLRVTWTLTDGESGESATIESYGAGADGGDKYSGKATTSAMKYALLAGFLLSTGDDVELTDTSDRQQQRPTNGQHAPSTPAPVQAAPPPRGPETEELLGLLTKAGTVKKGSGIQYDLAAREQPDGDHAIGFRLEVDGDKAIPQVLADGALGEALFMATAGHPEELLNQRVTVRGKLFMVRAPGRAGYYRMHLTEITTPDFTVPAPELSPDEAAAIAAAVDAAPRAAATA